MIFKQKICYFKFINDIISLIRVIERRIFMASLTPAGHTNPLNTGNASQSDVHPQPASQLKSGAAAAATGRTASVQDLNVKNTQQHVATTNVGRALAGDTSHRSEIENEARAFLGRDGAGLTDPVDLGQLKEKVEQRYKLLRETAIPLLKERIANKEKELAFLRSPESTFYKEITSIYGNKNKSNSEKKAESDVQLMLSQQKFLEIHKEKEVLTTQLKNAEKLLLQGYELKEKLTAIPQAKAARPTPTSPASNQEVAHAGKTKWAQTQEDKAREYLLSEFKISTQNTGPALKQELHAKLYDFYNNELYSGTGNFTTKENLYNRGILILNNLKE